MDGMSFDGTVGAKDHHLTRGDVTFQPGAQGIQGYDLWLRCLENGDWRKAHPHGVHHNVACWHECRCYAERFLRLAGGKLGGDLKPLFGEAAVL